MAKLPNSPTFHVIVKYAKGHEGFTASHAAQDLNIGRAITAEYLKAAAKAGIIHVKKLLTHKGKYVAYYFSSVDAAEKIGYSPVTENERSLKDAAKENARENIVFPSMVGLNTWGMVCHKKYGQPTSDF